MTAVDETGTAWVRHGECDSCGFCCRAISMVQVDFESDDPDFLAVRRIPPDGRKVLPIWDPCQHLTDAGRCGIYPQRPRTCREWPTTPLDVQDAPCTYWFENTETGERVGGTRSPYPVPE